MFGMLAVSILEGLSPDLVRRTSPRRYPQERPDALCGQRLTRECFVSSVCPCRPVRSFLAGVRLSPTDRWWRTQERAAESRQRHTLRMYSAVSSVMPGKSLVCSNSSVRLKNSRSGRPNSTKISRAAPPPNRCQCRMKSIMERSWSARPASVISSRSAAPR